MSSTHSSASSQNRKPHGFSGRHIPPISSLVPGFDQVVVVLPGVAVDEAERVDVESELLGRGVFQQFGEEDLGVTRFLGEPAGSQGGDLAGRGVRAEDLHGRHGGLASFQTGQ